MLDADQKPTDQKTVLSDQASAQRAAEVEHPAIDSSLHDAPLEDKLAATDEKAGDTAEQLQAPDALAASATDANPNPGQPELTHVALVEDGKQPNPEARTTAQPIPVYQPPGGKGAPETTSGDAAAKAPATGTVEERLAAMETRLEEMAERVATVGNESAQAIADLKTWLEGERNGLSETLQERHEGYLREFGRDQANIVAEDADADAERPTERPHVEDRLSALEAGFAKLRHFA